MSEKRISPPRTPSFEKRPATTRLTCELCEYSTTSPEALRVHLNKYHESDVAAGGKKGAGKGGQKIDKYTTPVLAIGYVNCKWWGAPCSGAANPLMQKICQHLNECLAGR